MKRIALLLALSLFLLVTMGYSYFNYQFWTHYRTDFFSSLTEYHGTNIRGLRGRQIIVHAKFIPYLKKIDTYAQQNGVRLIINQSYRNSKQSLGRTVVTPSKMSNHLAGFAIDFNIRSGHKLYLSKAMKRGNLKNLPQNIQNFIADIRRDKGLRWGGDFNYQDPVHIDYPLNLKSRSKWRAYSEACHKEYTQRVSLWKFWK